MGLSHHQLVAMRLRCENSPVLAAVARAHAVFGTVELAARLGTSIATAMQFVRASVELTRAASILAEASLKGEEVDPGVERAALSACADLTEANVSRAALAVARGLLDVPAPSNPGPVPGGSAATITRKRSR
jgi:hypothetical protein